MKRLLFFIVSAVLVFGVLSFSDGLFFTRQTLPQNGASNVTDSEHIIRVIEKAYEIEAKAAQTFDTTEFATVFTNDPRGGRLGESTIEFMRDVTNNPSLKTAGYLDYKVAYYTWWRDGALRLESLQRQAALEGRSLTEEEMSSLVDAKGRVAMPRAQDSSWDISLEFISILINDDIATVIFDDGPRTNKMTLVKIDGEWYIAGNEILAVHP